MHPYKIFSTRTSHHAVAEQLREAALPPLEVQKKIQEIFSQVQCPAGSRVGYIHHPFCEKLCKFCSFFRVLKDEKALPHFLDCLNESIRRHGEAPYVQAVPFEVFYFGGGTPTTISPEQMSGLLHTIRNNIPLADDVEFTSETTFANITHEMLSALKEGGCQSHEPRGANFLPTSAQIYWPAVLF